MAVTFDGPNRLIILETLVTSVDVEIDLYSDWKEWVMLSDNAKFYQAFRTIAGDPLPGAKSVSAHFFLQNQIQPDGGVGWRIRPPEEDIEIILDGNLWPETDTEDLIVPTLGAFTVLTQIERSADSLTTAGSSPTAIAAAVWAESSTQVFGADTMGEALQDVAGDVFRKLQGILFG